MVLLGVVHTSHIIYILLVLQKMVFCVRVIAITQTLNHTMVQLPRDVLRDGMRLACWRCRVLKSACPKPYVVK